MSRAAVSPNSGGISARKQAALPPTRSGLGGRSFWALMVAQFLGAANDNALKMLVVFLVLTQVQGGAAEQVPYISAVGAVFVLPYLLFSAWAGSLTDRFSKRRVLVYAKAAEVLAMGLAVAALWYGRLWACLVVLFLMGTQAAFFSPAKYGILPELLADEELSQGNGIIEMLTNIAIIIGTAAGGLLFDSFRGSLWHAGVIFLAIAAAGTTASLFVERVPPAAAGRRARINFLAQMWENLQGIRTDKALFLSILGASFFWLVGACFQLNFPVYATDLMKLSATGSGILLALLGVGIGSGALLAGRLSGKKVEFGLVPIGAAMMATFSFDLYLAWHHPARVAADLVLLGVGAGLYLIPLSAFVQQRAPADKKGLVIATNNFLAFSGILLASGVYFLAGRVLEWDPAEIFGLLSILVVCLAACIFTVLPDFLLRFCLWSFTHSFYRLRLVHAERVPKEGGALLVCNHVSYTDALLVLAGIQRFIRFIMFRRFYQHPALNWACRILKVIPISESDGPPEMARSLRAATEAIRQGELVCIFAEGSIARTGNMLRFERGFERIMEGLNAPIIPVHIDRMWGSILNVRRGRAVWIWPGLAGSKVTVSFGEPMSASATAPEVRQAVGDLGAEALRLRKADQVLLHEAFIRAARSAPFRMAMADSSGRSLTYAQALWKAVAVADLCRRELPDEETVGIVLPACVSAAVVNVGLLLAGKVPANLNATADEDAFRSALGQAGIRTIITSRAFTEKVPLPAEAPRTLYVEDLPALIGPWKAFKAAVKAQLIPESVLRRLYGARARDVDNVATIIFSSGTTGRPKGVMLTHSNIMSNIDGLAQVFGLTERDRICGVLPFFHAFGFTTTLWFPLVKRIGVAYHTSPFEGPAIGSLVREYGATLLLATPTFLRIYVDCVLPDDFGSLEHVVVGAERLPDDLRESFREKFGITPVEGYGCTECSPVVSLNVPDFRAPGIVQIGTRPGTIGQPLPGLSIRVVDTETREALPIGKDGLLLVKGLSVMKGYLADPERTSEVLQDGWYNTGDIARLDEDGFLTITDRLSRFSKIAGEMVPHLRVEEALAEALRGQCGDDVTPMVAVTSVPDRQKGERLIVLHKKLPVSADELLERLKASSLPRLWLPDRTAFIEVGEMPLLGTGKLDLKRLRTMAADAWQARAQA